MTWVWASLTWLNLFLVVRILKVVKSDSKTIFLFRQSKSVTHSVPYNFGCKYTALLSRMLVFGASVPKKTVHKKNLAVYKMLMKLAPELLSQMVCLLFSNFV